MAHHNQVGFIGLGRMGGPMAANIARAGFSLGVWNRTAEKVQALVALGAKPYSSPAAVARESEIVITMLSAPQDVQAVVLEPDGVLEGIRPGSIFVDMSTVSPATSLALASQFAAKQAEFLDAPVSGSVQPAAEGTLVILVGGLPSTLERVRPVFEAMGKAVIHAGDVGMGSTYKLAANLVLAHLTVGFAEALVLLEQSGADTKNFFEAVANAAFGSPWFETKGRSMALRNFTTQFSWEHMQKDLRLMVAHAAESGASVPVTEHIHKLYREGAEANPDFSKADFSAVLNFIEQSIKRPSSGSTIIEP